MSTPVDGPPDDASQEPGSVEDEPQEPAAPQDSQPVAGSPPPSIPIGASAPRPRSETHPDTDEIEVVLPLSVVRVVPNPAHEASTATRPTAAVGSGAAAAAPRTTSGAVGTTAGGPSTVQPAAPRVVTGRPTPSSPDPSSPDPSSPARASGLAGSPAPAAPATPEDPQAALRAARAAMSPGRRLRSAFRPRMTRAQVLAAVLCAVLGFALVVQLQQNQQDEFSGLRQSDLVRILDDVSKRSDALEREATSLRETEFELRSGSDSQQAAIELAEKNAEIQGILSGRLPAEGPGLEITIVQGDTAISAARLFNVLEELRNAGAEAIDVNGIRMVTSSYFEDTDSGVSIDGIVVAPPYRWTVIGDPQTLEPAMAIPGGAMASITTSGGRTTIEQKELVQIRSVRDPSEPRFAKPAGD